MGLGGRVAAAAKKLVGHARSGSLERVDEGLDGEGWGSAGHRWGALPREG